MKFQVPIRGRKYNEKGDIDKILYSFQVPIRGRKLIIVLKQIRVCCFRFPLGVESWKTAMLNFETTWFQVPIRGRKTQKGFQRWRSGWFQVPIRGRKIITNEINNNPTTSFRFPLGVESRANITTPCNLWRFQVPIRGRKDFTAWLETKTYDVSGSH